VHVQRLPDSGALQQLKVPQGLVIIEVVVEEHEYRLLHYYDQDVEWNGVSERYVPKAEATPFVRYTVENPLVNDQRDINQLLISEFRSGSTEPAQQHRFSYEPQTRCWTLTDQSGLRAMVHWTTPDAQDPDNTVHEFAEIRKGDQVFQRVQKTFHTNNNRGLLIRRVEGEGAVTRTTTYDYFTTGARAGLPMRILHADGRWEMFDYDTQGRMTWRFEGWLDGVHLPETMTEEDWLPYADQYQLQNAMIYSSAMEELL
jgi:hypothetical protein